MQGDHNAERLMKQTATVTQRCNTDRTCFFFVWGYMCRHQNHKDITS